MQEEFGPKAFFSDSSGNSFCFSFDVSDTILSFIVKAASATKESLLVLFAVSAVETSSSDVGWQPSKRPTFSSKKGGLVSIKIVKASFSSKYSGGKREFEKLGQIFVSVTETTTANVVYITSVIRQKWVEEYVLVMSDGLQLEDSGGTQGKYTVFEML